MHKIKRQIAKDKIDTCNNRIKECKLLLYKEPTQIIKGTITRPVCVIVQQTFIVYLSDSEKEIQIAGAETRFYS